MSAADFTVSQIFLVVLARLSLAIAMVRRSKAETANSAESKVASDLLFQHT
jgi:hypothetical protein